MWRFLWHWLFHRMRLKYENLAQDYTYYYLCKCGKAFTITMGWREGRKWFMDFAPADADKVKKFIQDVADDVRTL